MVGTEGTHSDLEIHNFVRKRAHAVIKAKPVLPNLIRREHEIALSFFLPIHDNPLFAWLVRGAGDFVVNCATDRLAQHVLSSSAAPELIVAEVLPGHAYRRRNHHFAQQSRTQALHPSYPRRYRNILSRSAPVCTSELSRRRRRSGAPRGGGLVVTWLRGRGRVVFARMSCGWGNRHVRSTLQIEILAGSRGRVLPRGVHKSCV